MGYKIKVYVGAGYTWHLLMAVEKQSNVVFERAVCGSSVEKVPQFEALWKEKIPTIAQLSFEFYTAPEIITFVHNFPK